MFTHFTDASFGGVALSIGPTLSPQVLQFPGTIVAVSVVYLAE